MDGQTYPPGYYRLVEKIEETKKELLEMFGYFAELNERGLIAHRLTLIDIRLLDVEKRLNIPPAA